MTFTTTSKLTGKYQTASGDYDRALELEFMQGRPTTEHGIGYTILKGDEETLELWVRFFRRHDQPDRETFARKRVAMGLHYLVPCQDPDVFHNWLQKTGAIRPKEPTPRKPKRQPEPETQVNHENRERVYQMMKRVAASMGANSHDMNQQIKS